MSSGRGHSLECYPQFLLDFPLVDVESGFDTGNNFWKRLFDQVLLSKHLCTNVTSHVTVLRMLGKPLMRRVL